MAEANANTANPAALPSDEALLRACYERLRLADLMERTALVRQLRVRLEIDCGVCGGACRGHGVGDRPLKNRSGEVR